MTRIGASPCPECGGPRELVATPSMWINTEAKRTGAVPYYHHVVCHACRIRWPGWGESGRVRRVSWDSAGIADYRGRRDRKPPPGPFGPSDPARDRGALWRALALNRLHGFGLVEEREVEG